MSQPFDVAVIGGGAAGYFAALHAAQLRPHWKVAIFEAAAKPLGKVRISGGGRCNVTHHQFALAPLLENYPRGHKQLRSVLSRFGPRQTIDWFEQRGVPLKVEPDGRMFPVSNSSQTIIDCLVGEAQRLKVDLRTQDIVRDLKTQEHGFLLDTASGQHHARQVVLATGSSARTYPWLARTGHTIIDPVPSLFTFTIDDPRLKPLPGVSVERATVTLDTQPRITQTGPLLITHWGLSGPAVLRTSAWGARELHQAQYRCAMWVDWLPDLTQEQLRQNLFQQKLERPKKPLQPITLPRRLWAGLLGSEAERDAGTLPDKQLHRWTDMLKRCPFGIEAKGVFKEEFVTAGGVDLADVDLKTMQSKHLPGLYMVGELLNVDGVTGGFNFQSAWATGWVAGQGLAGRE